MNSTLFFGLTIIVGAPAVKDPPQKESTIIGTWIAEKAIQGGKELPRPQGRETLQFTFEKDGTMTVLEGEQKPEVGSYKIDTKKDPPEIDLVPHPDKKEPTLLGIYKLNGETLTFALTVGIPGQAAERPKKLESPAESMVILVTLKRVKK